MLFEFFKWWYGSGWLDAWRSAGRSVKKVELAFSIPVLTHNLFAPWKRITAVPGRSIGDKFRAAVDNLISRTVGFVVRLCTLAAAGLTILLSSLAGLAMALAWPLLPVAVIYFLIRVFTG